MKRISFIALLMNLFFIGNIYAQEMVPKDSSATMATGPQYKASGWKQFLWGKHYRKEWITPAKFPVIDLDATAGGLTPTKRGGGHETKSLRMMGANGREYVLRTIDKSMDILIPEAFRGTMVNDIVNDQISTAHPFGPLPVAKLSAVAGVYHTNPVIVFVPANSRLREFSSDFANKLCLFEERTSGKGWENTALTGYADDVINTESLMEKLREGNNKSVDQKAYLRVRLFDMLINDWDRHEDQWVWLAHKKDGKTVYQPFARDRDQSFSKTDGLTLYFLSRPWVLQSLQHLDPKVKNVIGTNLAARYMDKLFLTALTEADWKEVIASLQASLTDNAIRDALKVMPDNIYNISGEHIVGRLISRRNDMMRFGLKYYHIINKEVDITGSDKKELFTINRIDDHSTSITVQKINKKDETTDTLYHKLFSGNETKRIYLYGLGGEDVFNTIGSGKSKIKITVIGGSGQDEFTASATGGKKIQVYDEKSNRTKTASVYRDHFTSDSLYNKYNRKRFEYDWYAPIIMPGYNPDDGFSLGASFTYKKKRWGKLPYAWKQKLSASYAFLTGATDFRYSGRFVRLFGKWDLDIEAAFRGPQYAFNYYGYGNDTKLLTDDRAYNRVRIKQLLFNPGIARTFGNQDIKIGFIAEQVKVEEKANRFVTSAAAGLDKAVFEQNLYIGGAVNYRIGKKNNYTFPTKGYEFNADVTYKRNVTTGASHFYNVNTSFSFYLPLGNVVLAHRTGGATNIGDFAFYHANTLGGSENLRGYNRTRFTADASFYQNTELRIPLTKLKGYVFNGQLGIYSFLDDGRVWIKNDPSHTTHLGYGGGVYFLPFNAAALNISFAHSDEANIGKLGLNFFF